MDFIKKHIEWLPALAIVIILGGSLPFKFGGSAETAHIFDVVGQFLGLEFFRTTGGYIIGAAELVACILLLIPAMRALGALLTVGIMAGAITFHLFSPLGVTVQWMENGEMQEDGTLFYMAIIAFLCGVWLVLRKKDDLLQMIGKGSASE
ncbi:MAG: DoxX family protein [Alphaproteobacteria bacterium]|nr:DoxX family protein [Alphaproteobacteria bacterium]